MVVSGGVLRSVQKLRHALQLSHGPRKRNTSRRLASYTQSGTVTFKTAPLWVPHILPERRRPVSQDHMTELEEGGKNLTAESLCRGIAQNTIGRQKKLYRTPCTVPLDVTVQDRSSEEVGEGSVKEFRNVALL